MIYISQQAVSGIMVGGISNFATVFKETWKDKEDPQQVYSMSDVVNIKEGGKDKQVYLTKQINWEIDQQKFAGADLLVIGTSACKDFREIPGNWPHEGMQLEELESVWLRSVVAEPE